jgi:DNA-binding CsgD family transcriptional regulator
MAAQLMLFEPVHPLTPREKQILLLVASGFYSKEIAWDLQVSVRTIECHRRNAMHKLGIKGRRALVEYVRNNL